MTAAPPLRVLLGPGAGGVASDDDLARLYAYPPDGGVRVNVVSTLDGAAAGADGRSGSINTPADHRVFALLRALADAVVVGAGTARAEEYGRAVVAPEWRSLREGRPGAPTLVVVTESGRLPDALLPDDGHAGPARDAGASGPGDPSERGDHGGGLLVATTSACPELARLRAALGEESVLVLDAPGADPGAADADDPAPGGGPRLDLPGLVAALAARGHTRLLCEGGPRLAGALAAAGCVDEWCGTLVPRLVGGGPLAGTGRVLAGPALDDAVGAARLASLLEGDGTILGRWLFGPAGRPNVDHIESPGAGPRL